MTVEIKKIIGKQEVFVPDDYDVLFAGSATTIDLPFESGVYYVQITIASPDHWVVCYVNTSVFSEINNTMRFGSYTRGGTQFAAGYFVEVSSVGGNLRFISKSGGVNFGSGFNITRPTTRILKGK
jgi:hypothetical protein